MNRVVLIRHHLPDTKGVGIEATNELCKQLAQSGFQPSGILSPGDELSQSTVRVIAESFGVQPTSIITSCLLDCPSAGTVDVEAVCRLAATFKGDFVIVMGDCLSVPPLVKYFLSCIQKDAVVDVTCGQLIIFDLQNQAYELLGQPTRTHKTPRRPSA